MSDEEVLLTHHALGVVVALCLAIFCQETIPPSRSGWRLVPWLVLLGALVAFAARLARWLLSLRRQQDGDTL